MPPPYDVVANLPYHITSPILHRLLGAPPRPDRLVLMVQREVAERIAAPPGGMSYLSVFVQYHAQRPDRVRGPAGGVRAGAAVRSAVIAVEPYPADDRLASADQEDALWRLVQAGFRERRKMLHNVLARQLPVEPARVDGRARRRRNRAGPAAPDARRREWLALLEALRRDRPDAVARRGDEPVTAADPRVA